MVESFFICGLFIFILGIMFLSSYLSIRNDKSILFIIHKKKSILNRFRVLKYWGIIQLVFLIIKLSGKIPWVLAILFPLFFISLYLIHYFFISSTDLTDHSEEWESIMKQRDRDKKLKKII